MKQKIKKPKKGWFRSLDDEHMIYAALHIPVWLGKDNRGATGLAPSPCFKSCLQNIYFRLLRGLIRQKLIALSSILLLIPTKKLVVSWKDTE